MVLDGFGASVAEAAFNDLYVGANFYWFKGIPGKKNPEPAPDHFKQELQVMYADCLKLYKEINKKDFEYVSNSVKYRASFMPAVNGPVFVLRKLSKKVFEIEDIGFPEYIVNFLMAPEATGLVLISGAPNQGKTMTASSILKSRLSKFGGIGITGEDPPENPLEGEHGKGVCFQTTADDASGGYVELAKTIVRWDPDIIMYGEIRDDEVAQEALKASISGRLVISTVHAEGVVETLHRVLSLAKNMQSKSASNLLSAGLYGVINQSLVINDTGKFSRVNQFLFVDKDNHTSVRKTILDDRLPMLSSEINAQNNRLLMSTN